MIIVMVLMMVLVMVNTLLYMGPASRISELEGVGTSV